MRIRRGIVGVSAFAALQACPFVLADEPKKETASITAIEPASLVAGGKTTLKIRGFKLKDATELRFPKAPGVKADIKEKKDVAAPAGLEAKQVGESQIVAEVTLPPDLPAGPLDYVVATPVGEAPGHILIAGTAAIEEKEPNNGFRAAQKLEPGKPVRGRVEKDKDVDVFEYPVRAGQKLKITAAGGSALLMDAALACYDTRGHLLTMADDSEGRDPSLTFTAAADGAVFICVSDAHDKGGEWHSYLLTVEEAK
jgi:hypothetical protein